MGLVFLFEVGTLLLASMTAAAFMATVPSLPANLHCDLGSFGLVPYISSHRLDYCLLAQSGLVYTALYYVASLGTMCVAHYFYISRRAPQSPIDSRQHYLGFTVAFWVVLVSWLLNYKGARGDWGSLTDRSHLPFFTVIIVLCVLHVAVILSKYQIHGRDGRFSATEDRRSDA